MTYGEIVIAVAYAMQMVIGVTFPLQLKVKGWKVVFLIPLSILNYCVVVKLSLSQSLWIGAYLYEFLYALIAVSIFDTGNLWRNFTILWFNFQVTNVLFSVFNVILNFFTGYIAKTLYTYSLDNYTTIFEAILIVVIALGVSRISKKFFRFSYDGDGKIYKFFSFAILFVGTITGAIRHIMSIEIRDLKSAHNLNVVLLYFATIASVIVIINLLGYLYNLSEVKRIKLQKEFLEKKLYSDNNQYKEIVEGNKELVKIKQELDEYIEKSKEKNINLSSYSVDLNNVDEAIVTLPLSGKILVDGIIFSFYKWAKERDIIFEVCVEQLDYPKEDDIRVAAILDSLREYSCYYVEKIGNVDWFELSIRNVGKNIIIKFAHNQTDKHKNNFKTSKKRNSILLKTRNIVTMYNGTVEIKNLQDETNIDILIL